MILKNIIAGLMLVSAASQLRAEVKIVSTGIGLELSVAENMAGRPPVLEIRVVSTSSEGVFVLPLFLPEAAENPPVRPKNSVRFEIEMPDGSRSRYLTRRERYSLVDMSFVTGLDFVRLPPGMFLGQRISLSEGYEYDLSQPGAYRVRAVFETEAGRYFREKGTVKSEDTCRFFDGKVASNEVTFVVSR